MKGKDSSEEGWPSRHGGSGETWNLKEVAEKLFT